MPAILIAIWRYFVARIVRLGYVQLRWPQLSPFTILKNMCKCSFCGSEVEALRIANLDLRICPKCYSIYFPCNQTFAFYGGLSDKTRELWLEDLKKKNVQDPVCENPKCIDHGEPLVKGKLPHYGFDGYVTTCCEMFHMPPSTVKQLLQWSLDIKAAPQAKEGKHHFFFIHWIDSLVSKLFGEKPVEEDPLDLIQYNRTLRKFFE